MASFDSDSSFWVCNNSATGHICNDRSLFHGELVPSTFSVSAATGTSETNLMGTIVLSVRDDDGVEHTFTLREVVYMKDSPVNLLSTRRLAEQFPDEAGRPDRRGTGIMSLFEEHTLFWNHKRFQKTF